MDEEDDQLDGSSVFNAGITRLMEEEEEEDEEEEKGEPVIGDVKAVGKLTSLDEETDDDGICASILRS